MSEPLRPHVLQLEQRIHDVKPWPAGGYVISSSAGIQLVDENLVLRQKIFDTDAAMTIIGDGKIILSHDKTKLWSAGTVTNLEIGSYVRAAWQTADGFMILGSDRIVIDKAGARTTVKLGKDRHVGFARWRDGLVIADRQGVQILDGAGVETAKAEGYITGDPIVLGDRIVVSTLEQELRVLDETAQLVATHASAFDKAIAFAGGVLLVPRRDGDGDVEFALLGLEPGADGAAFVERWKLQAPTMDHKIVGDRLVILVENGAWIVDANGQVERIADREHGTEVAAFEDGIAFLGTKSQWWRPGAGVTPLDYDGWPRHVRTTPTGIVAAEEEVLLVWRAGQQGPEPTPLTTDLPMNKQIIVDGAAMTIVGTNRFTLNVQAGKYTVKRSPKYKAWRDVTTREEAAPLVERLIARTFDGPLPEIPAGGLFEQRAALATLPLAQIVDLVGRGMFSAASLDEKQLQLARFLRPGFFGELELALGQPARSILAAVRSRKQRLAPPQPVVGYDYLGTFTTSGALVVSDPIYIDKRASGGVSLALKVAGHEGIWHVFVRNDKANPALTAELAVVHDTGFAIGASDAIGVIGNDTGFAGVFDKACAKQDANIDPYSEGTVLGLGAHVSSGHGDGTYPVFVGRAQGKVSKIRISFIDAAPEVDRLVAVVSTGRARAYAASARFELGDTLEHVKFGTGAVIRVGADGKIDVRFADATRTLVHAKK